jgi:hypothetical protein
MFGAKHRAEQKAAAEKARTAELRQALVNLIALAEGGKGSEPDGSLVLRSGERLVLTLAGAGLFEPRRQPGHWTGRSAGVSVPVPDTRLRVRVGKSAGTFVQGAETPTVIDTGDASITSERVVFQGGKYTRDWEFTKLIGVLHYSDHPATAIQVSNREKTSGLVYPGAASPEPVRLAMTVAIAIFHGEIDETVKELRDELARLEPASPSSGTDEPRLETGTSDHDVARPDVAPGPAPSPPANATEPVPGQPESSTVPPPMWAADPSGRHQWRYWDGKSWTEFVSDKGQQARDPLSD